jgi:SAM-dependent methyltransferase
MTDAHTQIIDLYRRHADAWMTCRSTHLFEKAWLDRFLQTAPDQPTILDIGCGSGEPIGRYLSQAGTLTGVDTSPELIAIARHRMTAPSWIVADMRTLDLNATFDAVLAWNSFFHLTQDDQRAMFPIFRKHAAPGAALMFTSGTSHGEAIGEFVGEPLYHASLDPAEYRALLDQHGFRVVDHVVEDPDCGNHTIWLAQLN